MKNESNAKSFQAKVMYKNIKVQYFLTKCDFESGNKYAKEIVKLIEDNYG